VPRTHTAALRLPLARHRKISPGWVLRLLAPPVLITSFFYATSLNTVSPEQALAAFLLLCFPWWTYSAWKREPRWQLPFFAFVAFVYWVYYAVPLFWGDRIRPSTQGTPFVSDGAVTLAMWMAVAGVAALWAGTKLGIGKRLTTKRVRDVPPDSRRWNYLRMLLIAGGFLSLYPNSAYIAGEEGRQFILAVESLVPLIIFVILFRSYLRGTASRLDKYTIVIFLATQFVLGVSSGWLGAWLSVALAAVAAYLLERRRLPLLPIALAVSYVLFFQAGKDQYRTIYWVGGQQGNVLDRVGTWMDLSLSKWQQSLQSGDIGPQLVHGAVVRASLLEQTAAVIDSTPALVPYQLGRTYPYVVEGLIPRFVWQGKPSGNEANQFYQVAYGVTNSQNLSSVSIAVGILTEGYINFGWPGVILVMLLVGVLFDVVATTFLSRGSGYLFAAIGIAILLQFMTIESQMALYVGGLVQKVALALLLLVPATRTVPRGQAAEGPDG
jgi:hypothetical protein